MKNLIEYKSNISGLWSIFITKIIASFFLAYHLPALLFSLDIISKPLASNVITLLVLILSIIYSFKEYPSKWKNRVTIDFQKELVIINNKKNELKTANVLDFDGKQYSFNEIDSYSVTNSNSFSFNSYHLVKFFVKGKEIKLLSFKGDDDFIPFIEILKNQLNLKTK